MANICGGRERARAAADYPPSSPGDESGLQEPNLGIINSNTSSSATTSFMASVGSDGTKNGGFKQGCFLEGQILEAPNLRKFTFLEIQRVTKNFRPDYLLGEGGFGWVYKAWVDEKTMSPARSGARMAVAIMHGNEEWQKFLVVHLQSDINLLGRFSHPNLVKLLGYCWEGKELFLVNEFMAKGSLKDHIFGGGCAPLSWEQRLKIAIGAARGLAFFHATEKKAMYRDFKASKILLDAHYNAKLSDFGLAKLGSTGNSRMTIMPTRTHGYAAPEYVITGLLYAQSDVYGFGVMMLEMVSGQRARDPNRPKGQMSIIDWAKPLADRRKIARLMDPRLEGQYNSKQALQAVHVALSCLAGEPRSRPSMEVVLEALEQI